MYFFPKVNPITFIFSDCTFLRSLKRMERGGNKAGLPTERHQAFWGSRLLGQKSPGDPQKTPIPPRAPCPPRDQVRGSRARLRRLLPPGRLPLTAPAQASYELNSKEIGLRRTKKRNDPEASKPWLGSQLEMAAQSLSPVLCKYVFSLSPSGLGFVKSPLGLMRRPRLSAETGREARQGRARPPGEERRGRGAHLAAGPWQRRNSSPPTQRAPPTATRSLTAGGGAPRGHDPALCPTFRPAAPPAAPRSGGSLLPSARQPVGSKRAKTGLRLRALERAFLESGLLPHLLVLRDFTSLFPSRENDLTLPYSSYPWSLNPPPTTN